VQLDLLLEFFSQQWLLLLALAATLTMLFLHESRKAGPAASPQQAINLVNGEGGIFLDIRDGAEYNKAHIADAQRERQSFLGVRTSRSLWSANWANHRGQQHVNYVRQGLAERKKCRVG